MKINTKQFRDKITGMSVLHLIFFVIIYHLNILSYCPPIPTAIILKLVTVKTACPLKSTPPI